MSRVPMGSDVQFLDANNEKLRHRLFLVPQGISADLIATREGFTRQDVDKFALASQQKAARAIEEKRFGNAMFAVKADDGSVALDRDEHPRADVDNFALHSQQKAARAIEEKRFAKSLFMVKTDDGAPALDRDEHPRADTTIESLAGLNAAFEKLGAMKVGYAGETLDELALKRYPDTKAIQHVHTAGNSSGIVDGAAIVLMGSAEWGKKAGQKPRARIRAIATAGAEPVIMLTAPAPASERALKQAGMSVKDIDMWEINEAFATVPMQTAKVLGIDMERINVNGGAIALGHPLGATGAILLGTALDELERSNKSTALITLCIGGGMGIAMIIERI
jgi:acetyl-CoA C-acetyltransferase